MISYLALGKIGRASRERLMGLFWPDRAEPQARASLRQCLVELRVCLVAALAANREWVTLDLAQMTGDCSARVSGAGGRLARNRAL